MKWWVVLLALLFVLQPVSADVFEDLQELDAELKSFTQGEQVIIVQGDKLSPGVQVFLLYAPSFVSDGAIPPRYHEDEVTPELLEDKTVIILGGPLRNGMADDVLASGAQEVREVQGGKVVFITDGEDKYLVVAEKRDFTNLPKDISDSPLAKFIPEKWVPVAATGVGIGLLMLLKVLGKLLLKVARQHLSSKIMRRVKKKPLTEKFVGFHMFGIRFKLKEFVAMFVAAAIFALALAKPYFQPDMNIWVFAATAVGVNLVVYAIRHGSRLLFDRKYKTHSEYKLWILGVFVTAITGWLGNTFALAGYIAQSGKKGDIPEGEVAFKVNLVSQNAFLVFWVWNFLAPTPLTQMAMLLVLSITFIQLLPIEPFEGKKIYGWSKKRWWFNFIPMATIYFFIHLYG